MAHASRRAVGLDDATSDTSAAVSLSVVERCGLGDPTNGGWVPLAKLKMIARRLVDVFDHDSVDLIGNGIGAYPGLDALVTYCHDIGLATSVVLEPRSLELDAQGHEPAGTRWSLADTQRRPDAAVCRTAGCLRAGTRSSRR